MSGMINAVCVGEVEGAINQFTGMLANQATLRAAIFDSISCEDVRQIVAKQIAKAKEGDEKSLQFVMRYVLGFGQDVNLQQFLVMDTETAARLAKGKAFS